MSSLASTLSLIQQNIIRYGFPIILALGNAGNILCVAVFLQKHHRENAGSLYLLAAVIFGLFGVNWGVATNMNAIYRPPDVFSLSIPLCRTRGYILQVSAVLFRTMLVLASATRVASSSTRASMRTFNKPKTSLKMIGIATLFWLIASIHLPIFQTISAGRCAVFGDYGVFFSIYQMCILGIILPGLMIIFSLLIWKNLRTTRNRIRPQEGVNHAPQQVLTRRDLNFIRLLFTEITTGLVLTTPYPVVLLYNVLVANVRNKSADRIQIEAFVTFLSLVLLFYLNYSFTFYMYVITSKSFRKEVKQLILKCINRAGQHETRGTSAISSTARA